LAVFFFFLTWFECSELIQFDSSNFHQEFDLWFYWIVGQLTLSSLSFEIWKSTFWWNRSPFCTNAEIWNMLLEFDAVAGFKMWSDDASRLIWFLLMVGSVGLLITIAVWNFGCIGLVVLSGLGSCRTHPVCLSVCQCASRVISSEQFTCLYWTFSKATVSVWRRICLHRGAHMCAHRRRRDEILPLRKWDSERSRPRRLRVPVRPARARDRRTGRAGHLVTAVAKTRAATATRRSWPICRLP